MSDENIDISADGQRVRLFRDVGNVTMDLGGIEHIQLNALGGADTVTVNDLTGTDAKQVAIDLSAMPGSGQGDGQADTVIVNGTAGNDRIGVVSSGSSIVVNGLAAQVTVNGAEGGNNSLVVNGLAAMTPSTLPRCTPVRSTSRLTAATEMTPSSAAPAMTRLRRARQ